MAAPRLWGRGGGGEMSSLSEEQQKDLRRMLRWGARRAWRSVARAHSFHRDVNVYDMVSAASAVAGMAPYRVCSLG